jgi:hypothetical protein
MMDRIEEFEQLLDKFEDAHLDYAVMGAIKPSEWPAVRGRCNRARNELLDWVKKVLDKG